MTSTFARELSAENTKTEAFREYSQTHLLHEGSIDHVPELSVSFASAPGSTTSESGSLDWGSTDNDGSIAVLDRTTEREGDTHKNHPQGKAPFPDDAPTIPRRQKTTPEPPPDTTRRLTWLVIVTLFALIAGGITIHYALESMTPGTALITIRSTDDNPITHIRILDATKADEEIYAGPSARRPSWHSASPRCRTSPDNHCGWISRSGLWR